MYYYCAKHSGFKLPSLASRIPQGSIIAASAVPFFQLARRSFAVHPHFRHRLLDPQVYLSSLDPRTAASAVYKLATYPWFGCTVPDYNSRTHNLNEYKAEHIQELHSQWSGEPPKAEETLYSCVRSALEVQEQLGCEGLIIPSPLTHTASDYEYEAAFIDVGLQVAEEIGSSLPILATIAISDAVLRGIEPTQNALLQTITSHIAARDRLSGVYVVLEQTADTGYVCVNENTLLSLLILSDDVARGSGKQVIVNYVGPFGAVLASAGAGRWTSGYYRSQRRLRLADQEEEDGRAYPRFYSSALAGDIGVQDDLPNLHDDPELFPRLFNRTDASRSLHAAISAGSYPGGAPEWAYRPGQIAAAAAHYNDICCKFDSALDGRDRGHRVDSIQRWLEHAAELAARISVLGVSPAHTDTRHQAIWLSSFNKWRGYSGI